MKRDEASCFCVFLRCHSAGRRASLWWGLSKLNAELGYTDFKLRNTLNLKWSTTPFSTIHACIEKELGVGKWIHTFGGYTLKLVIYNEPWLGWSCRSCERI